MEKKCGMRQTGKGLGQVGLVKLVGCNCLPSSQIAHFPEKCSHISQKQPFCLPVEVGFLKGWQKVFCFPVQDGQPIDDSLGTGERCEQAEGSEN